MLNNRDGSDIMKTRVRIIVEAETADGRWVTTGDTDTEFTFGVDPQIDRAHDLAVTAATALRKAIA